MRRSEKTMRGPEDGKVERQVKLLRWKKEKGLEPGVRQRTR